MYVIGGAGHQIRQLPVVAQALAQQLILQLDLFLHPCQAALDGIDNGSLVIAFRPDIRGNDPVDEIDDLIFDLVVDIVFDGPVQHGEEHQEGLLVTALELAALIDHEPFKGRVFPPHAEIKEHQENSGLFQVQFDSRPDGPVRQPFVITAPSHDGKQYGCQPVVGRLQMDLLDRFINDLIGDHVQVQIIQHALHDLADGSIVGEFILFLPVAFTDLFIGQLHIFKSGVEPVDLCLDLHGLYDIFVGGVDPIPAGLQGIPHVLFIVGHFPVSITDACAELIHVAPQFPVPGLLFRQAGPQ